MMRVNVTTMLVTQWDNISPNRQSWSGSSHVCHLKVFSRRAAGGRNGPKVGQMCTNFPTPKPPRISYTI
eukprot:4065159-Amphidinium_carterae.1